MSKPIVDPRIRQIKIQTGVVSRYAKEKLSYEKEAVALCEKVEKMKAAGKCEHDIKKQIEVANESKAMIPDCLRRLKENYGKLVTMLETEKDLEETEEYKKAQSALENAKAQVE